jgi:hypothetical protein
VVRAVPAARRALGRAPRCDGGHGADRELGRDRDGKRRDQESRIRGRLALDQGWQEPRRE